MLLRHVGVRKLGALVESRKALVRYLDRQLDETGLFVRLNDVDFYRLAFVFCPPPVRVLLVALPAQSRRDAASVVSAYTSRLSAALYEEGRACFDEHTLADLGNRVGLGEGTGYNVMACCPGNPLLTRQDLDAAVERLTATARPLIPAMLAALAQPTQRNPQRPVAGPAGWNDQL